MDLATLRQWVGNARETTGAICPGQARLLAATIDMDPAAIEIGQPLRPLWHWIYMLEGLRPGELGRDGHPARGGFLPPVPLANRMWAGGDVTFHAPLKIGAQIIRRSVISSIDLKHGSSGPLLFIVVTHELFEGDRLLITERHDIVYRDPIPANARKPSPEMPEAAVHREFKPDATMLFRYSALTFNGHRIHYDVEYCRHVEGYAGLVVHGPLVATMLAGVAQDNTAQPLRRFSYRGISPTIAGTPIMLKATLQASGMILWSEAADGSIGMTATGVV
jgi:3-methylfumaryl-CoA hydratase